MEPRSFLFQYGFVPVLWLYLGFMTLIVAGNVSCRIFITGVDCSLLAADFTEKIKYKTIPLPQVSSTLRLTFRLPRQLWYFVNWFCFILCNQLWILHSCNITLELCLS